MPRPPKHQIVRCQYFNWRIFSREGVWWADGRANAPSLGRKSLGSVDRQIALVTLQKLDAKMAVKHGLAKSDAPLASDAISLAKGLEMYQQHVLLPRVAGGASPGTWKRYRAVFDKFLPFISKSSVQTWNNVKKSHLESYAAWLDGEQYAYRTQFLELTTIKQMIGWLVKAKHLSADCLIDMPLPKPNGSDTYCWRTAEVAAMFKHCDARSDLAWLRGVLVALTSTGMRISELANLRWSDLDLASKIVTLKDESSSRPGITDKRATGRVKKRERRQTKGRRSRSFPLHTELQKVLEGLEHARDGFVFHGPLGGALSPDVVRRALIREVLTPLAEQFPACDGDIGFKDGRLHSFRHYFCSLSANSGVPEQMVMNWLGHQESKMVRHYYHAHHEEAQRQMQKIRFVG